MSEQSRVVTEPAPHCPECGWPLDGGAKGLSLHHDCAANVASRKALQKLRHQVADLVHTDHTLAQIAYITRVGRQTIEPIVREVLRASA